MFEWEYVDPANPGLGKRESSTLAPDGAFVDLTFPSLVRLDLTKAYFFGARLQQFRMGRTILNEAYLAEANMYNLQGNGLIARGADMAKSNLERARLVGADLSMTSFAGAKLTGADLGGSKLLDADFTGATITDARLARTTANGFAAS